MVALCLGIVDEPQQLPKESNEDMQYLLCGEVTAQDKEDARAGGSVGRSCTNSIDTDTSYHNSASELLENIKGTEYEHINLGPILAEQMSIDSEEPRAPAFSEASETTATKHSSSVELLNALPFAVELQNHNNESEPERISGFTGRKTDHYYYPDTQLLLYRHVPDPRYAA